ncbi:MAG: class I SAM-dependent RNA methyltransferase [Dehalococcoidia bacterium]
MSAEIEDAPIPPPPKQPRKYRRGDELRLTLGKIVNRGAALAHTPEGQVVFVAYGAPGEEVIAAIDRVQKDQLQAHVTEVLTPSPDRVQPLCPYFGACGGCNYQFLPYERQLEIKREIVVETFRRVGSFREVCVPPTVPSPSPWFYRNQARFSTNRWGDVGFTRRGTNNVLRVETCYIVEPPIRDLLPRLQGKGAGLHQIVVRSNRAGEALIAPDMANRGVEAPSGQASMIEIVAGHGFRVSPSAFFQVNTPQAETMVRLVAERLALEPDDRLADLYAGVGFFSRIFADRCSKVVAIEVSRLAADDAAWNLSGAATVDYRLGEVEKVLPDLAERPTKILLDPSREGCVPAAVDAMLACRPERIVYVSCDAATLARDLRRMVDGGYQLVEVQPLDMFPQTHHTECIALLMPAARPNCETPLR